MKAGFGLAWLKAGCGEGMVWVEGRGKLGIVKAGLRWVWLKAGCEKRRGDSGWMGGRIEA